jgi:hypothetical protein
MPERIKFEAIEPETSINLRYYGRPCVVTRIGKIGDKVRAVGVRLGINNQEFVHIALEKKRIHPRVAWPHGQYGVAKEPDCYSDG